MIGGCVIDGNDGGGGDGVDGDGVDESRPTCAPTRPSRRRGMSVWDQTERDHGSSFRRSPSSRRVFNWPPANLRIFQGRSLWLQIKRNIFNNNIIIFIHTHTHAHIYIEFFCYYFNFNLHRIFFEMKMNRWINLYMGWIFVWLNFVWLERVQNLGLLWWKHFQGIGRRTCASGQREVKWKRRIEKKNININKNIKK